jgi:hypothetical protein
LPLAADAHVLHLAADAHRARVDSSIDSSVIARRELARVETGARAARCNAAKGSERRSKN